MVLIKTLSKECQNGFDIDPFMQSLPIVVHAGTHILVFKHLRVAYNAYRILRYTHRNVGDRQRHITCFVRTLMPWLKTICTPLLNDAYLHPTFFRSLQFSDAFYKSPFSPIMERFCMTMTECSSYWCFV